jgi:DNA-binding transcriptional regulator YiaG
MTSLCLSKRLQETPLPSKRRLLEHDQWQSQLAWSPLLWLCNGINSGTPSCCLMSRMESVSAASLVLLACQMINDSRKKKPITRDEMNRMSRARRNESNHARDEMDRITRETKPITRDEINHARRFCETILRDDFARRSVVSQRQ